MRTSEIAGRVGLVALGLLLAVALLEVLLQLGAWAVRAGGDRVSGFSTTQAFRILCLGDSNTYGVRLADRETQAYPGQLEAQWNASGPARPVEVLNAGYPGTNSSMLRRNFPEMLEAFEPDLVLVMVGVNDFWTEPVSIESPERAVPGFDWRWSRVVRLVRLLRPRLDSSDLEVVVGRTVGNRSEGVVRFGGREFPMGYEQADPRERSRRRADAPEALAQNLRELADPARSLGVDLVLLTYPARHREYGRTNKAIRRAVRESDLRLVDLAPVFRPFCPRPECPDWFYEDQHPKAAGYRVVAEAIVSQLAGSEVR